VRYINCIAASEQQELLLSQDFLRSPCATVGHCARVACAVHAAPACRLLLLLLLLPLLSACQITDSIALIFLNALGLRGS
jgi:hypothetical protein